MHCGVPFDRGLTPSYCFKGKSVYEVADKAGLNPSRAEETVRKYNQSAAAGRDDDFGRFSLSSGYGKLRVLDTAPFTSCLLLQQLWAHIAV